MLNVAAGFVLGAQGLLFGMEVEDFLVVLHQLVTDDLESAVQSWFALFGRFKRKPENFPKSPNKSKMHLPNSHQSDTNVAVSSETFADLTMSDAGLVHPERGLSAN